MLAGLFEVVTAYVREEIPQINTMHFTSEIQKSKLSPNLARGNKIRFTTEIYNLENRKIIEKSRKLCFL